MMNLIGALEDIILSPASLLLAGVPVSERSEHGVKQVQDERIEALNYVCTVTALSHRTSSWFSPALILNLLKDQAHIKIIPIKIALLAIYPKEC